MKKLIFITGNQNKADFLTQHLGIPVGHKKLDLDEIQSLDARKVAGHKARQAYEIIKQPVLIEDVSLTLAALNNLPGPFIKFFEQSLGLDGICRLLDGCDDRSTVGTTTYCLFDGTEIHYFEGKMTGKIADKPRGKNGFGFDPIFINDGFDKTRAEMTEKEYVESSYRTPAIKKLQRYLEKSLAEV